MADEPVQLPIWASDTVYTGGPRPGQPTKVLASAPKAAQGYDPGEKPPGQEENAWRNNMALWVQYLNARRTRTISVPVGDVESPVTVGPAVHGASAIAVFPINGASIGEQIVAARVRVRDRALSAWVASTVYAPGNRVTHVGNVYEVTTGGTSAASGGPTGTSTSIVDGSVTWKYIAAVGAANTGSLQVAVLWRIEGSSTLAGSGPRSSGAVAVQTLSTAGLALPVLSATSYYVVLLDGGVTSASSDIFAVEVDLAPA